MIIRGAGQGQTIIDASGNGGLGDRVFQMFSQHAVTLQDLTIQGGRAGAGVLASGVAGSSVTLQRVTLTGNIATSSGGAIAVAVPTVVNVIESTIANNSASGGGGIINFGTLNVARSTISTNTANGLGGAIQSSSGTTTRILDSTISGNRAADGAGLANFNGSLTITNSTVSGNISTGATGGLFNISSGAGNVSTATILQSTITGNQQAGLGAVHTTTQNGATSAPLSIGNTLLVNNTGGSRNLGQSNSGAAVTSLGGNLSTDAASGLLTSAGDQINVSVPVINATLADNGGPTRTHALVAGSPAIDTASDPRLTSELVTPVSVTSSTAATDFFDVSELLNSQGLTLQNAWDNGGRGENFDFRTDCAEPSRSSLCSPRS